MISRKYRIDLAALNGKNVKCNMLCKYCHKDYFCIDKYFDESITFTFFELIKFSENLYNDNAILDIHLTGRAEPLVVDKKRIFLEISSLKKNFPNASFSMTTNGLKLKYYADILKSSGLEKVNISYHYGYNSSSDVYVRGIESSLSAGLKVILNAVVTSDTIKYFDEYVNFISKLKISAKFFCILLNNLQESETIYNKFTELITNKFGMPEKYDESKHRNIFNINDEYQIIIKLPEKSNKRPDACNKCYMRKNCNEGCWNSIRITPWYIKPCGVREDNVYFPSENNPESLKEKLYTGGKLF